MSRLIDADALIADCQLAQKQADRHGREFANAFYSGGGEISTEWWCVEDMIENAPTIEERKTGRWKHGREVSREYVGTAIVAIRYEHWECSECGYRTDNEPVWKYCPNCGAKMEKTEG